MTRVAFLGPLGTYTHQAALQQFPGLQDSSVSGFEPVPLKTIPDCFTQLQNDTSLDYCVVPFENSTNGQVVFTYDLIKGMLEDMLKKLKNERGEEEIEQHRGANYPTKPLYKKRLVPPLHIVAEQYVAIEHCLVTADEKISFDVSKSEDATDALVYETLYSHPQVWGQISQYLETTLKDRFINRVDCSSTSEAIKLCKEDYVKHGKKSLAVGSKIGAILNDAYIIEEGINDLKGNTTRFLILQRVDNDMNSTTTAVDEKNNNDQKFFNGIGEVEKTPLLDIRKRMMTLLTFTTQREGPGSLVDVLNILQKYNINMTSISSRPSGGIEGGNWSYLFFVEYEFDHELPWKSEILPQIDSKCTFWSMWGVFNRNDGYYKTF